LTKNYFSSKRKQRGCNKKLNSRKALLNDPENNLMIYSLLHAILIPYICPKLKIEKIENGNFLKKIFDSN